MKSTNIPSVKIVRNAFTTKSIAVEWTDPTPVDSSCPHDEACSKASGLTPLQEQPERAPEQSAAKLRILIVDDHPANRLLLNNQLELLGHQVDEANNGLEALNKVESQGYDLIITDCDMPVMDGITLTQRIRNQLGEIRSVRIFGLTANALPSERLRCIEAGMDDCLLKPLRLPQLEAVLRTVTSGVEVSTPLPELPALISLSDLQSMFPDEEMVRRMLRKVREENQLDILQVKNLLANKSWSELKSSLHRIGGAAQIIFAEEVNNLNKILETLSDEAVNELMLTEGINKLETLLDELNRAIEAYTENP